MPLLRVSRVILSVAALVILAIAHPRDSRLTGSRLAVPAHDSSSGRIRLTLALLLLTGAALHRRPHGAEAH